MAGPHSTCGDQGELVRIDNSISYVLPTSFGLTNFFFVHLGEQEGSFNRGNMYNYAAKFDKGPFSATTSYAWESMLNGIAEGIANERYKVQWPSYDLGFTKPVVQFEKKWGDPDKGSSDFWMAQIGTSTPVFGGLWMVSASYFKNESREDADSLGVGTKFNYPLSKRPVCSAAYRPCSTRTMRATPSKRVPTAPCISTTAPRIRSMEPDTVRIILARTLFVRMSFQEH